MARVSLLSSTSGQNNRFVSRRRRESRRPCGSTSSHQGHRQWLNQQKISHRVHPFKKSEKKDITRRRSRSSGGRDPQSSSGNPWLRSSGRPPPVRKKRRRNPWRTNGFAVRMSVFEMAQSARPERAKTAWPGANPSGIHSNRTFTAHHPISRQRNEKNTPARARPSYAHPLVRSLKNGLGSKNNAIRMYKRKSHTGVHSSTYLPICASCGLRIRGTRRPLRNGEVGSHLDHKSDALHQNDPCQEPAPLLPWFHWFGAVRQPPPPSPVISQSQRRSMKPVKHHIKKELLMEIVAGEILCGRQAAPFKSCQATTKAATAAQREANTQNTVGEKEGNWHRLDMHCTFSRFQPVLPTELRVGSKSGRWTWQPTWCACYLPRAGRPSDFPAWLIWKLAYPLSEDAGRETERKADDHSTYSKKSRGKGIPDEENRRPVEWRPSIKAARERERENRKSCFCCFFSLLLLVGLQRSAVVNGPSSIKGVRRPSGQARRSYISIKRPARS